MDSNHVCGPECSVTPFLSGTTDDRVSPAATNATEVALRETGDLLGLGRTVEYRSFNLRTGDHVTTPDGAEYELRQDGRFRWVPGGVTVSLELADALGVAPTATPVPNVARGETRADGWPLCPTCGQDELWSPDGRIGTIAGCYACGRWKAPPEHPGATLLAGIALAVTPAPNVTRGETATHCADVDCGRPMGHPGKCTPWQVLGATINRRAFGLPLTPDDTVAPPPAITDAELAGIRERHAQECWVCRSTPDRLACDAYRLLTEVARLREENSLLLSDVEQRKDEYRDGAE